MASLSLAWVLVTAIKEGGELEFSPVIFVLTGMVDMLVFVAIFGIAVI